MVNEIESEAHKPYENIWVLKTDDMIPNLTWWWWWWIFFIKDPDNPGRTKQFMILWSTKYTDDIQVMDMKWKLKQLPTLDDDGVLKFNGMTAAWWYDGKDMHDPIVLEEMDFEVRHDGESGELKPLMEGTDYRFFGSPEKYTVNVKDAKNDFHFEMTPWNDYMQEHRFNERQYTKKLGYNILKIYGMKMTGTIDGQPIEGTAYEQRVTVNAPAPTWYWGIGHGEDGSYFEYFNPFFGPQIFRTTEKPTSALDWGDIRLSKNMRFYHHPTQTLFLFDKKDIKITHEIENDLPVFYVTGKDEEKEMHIKIQAYARAYWRFQQPRRFGMRSILYYNEYPSEVDEFSFRKLDGSLTVRREDLGHMGCNIEHSWGKLI